MNAGFVGELPRQARREEADPSALTWIQRRGGRIEAEEHEPGGETGGGGAKLQGGGGATGSMVTPFSGENKD